MQAPRVSHYLLLLIIAAVIAAGLVLDFLGYLTPVKTTFQALISPPLSGITGVDNFLSSTLQGYQDVRTLQEKNKLLQEQLDSLMIENVRLRELEQENKQLHELLNFSRNNTRFDLKAAAIQGQVIGANPSGLLYFLLINVGARDGVAEGMPVVTDRGLVGKITRVGANSSQILLLIDPSSVVSGRIQSSRITGLIHGSFDGSLVMERISQDAKVAPGDIVLTSGLGGSFPDKIVIGQVAEVTQSDTDIFQKALIRPTVDFSRLEYVLVVTDFQPVDMQKEFPADDQAQ